MPINERDINNFKNLNADKIKAAADIAQKTLGKDADKIKSIMSDKEKLNKIASNLTKSDLEKVSKVLDNPELLKQILSNDKARANIKKMMGE